VEADCRRRVVRKNLNRSFETDKRRYIRYEMLDYVVVRPNNGTASSNSIIVDIGLGGLQLRTREMLPTGEHCTMEVGRVDSTPLVLKGEIRHSSAVPGSDLYASGIRFKPENHEDRIAIAEYVHAIFQRQCDLLAT
jgi:hypothetical protein